VASVRSVCVYCGSSFGHDPVFVQTVERVGTALARRGVHVVFGGGRVGLMGVLADAVLAAGGTITGITTDELVAAEIAHAGLTKLHIVDTMHARKAMMACLADGFIALPGGTGTLEEIMEQWTWAQLGIHKKPCGILDIDGYFAPMLSMVDAMQREGFIDASHASMLLVDTDISRLLDAFGTYEAPMVRWPEISD